jgi:hypothetical protein
MQLRLVFAAVHAKFGAAMDCTAEISATRPRCLVVRLGDANHGGRAMRILTATILALAVWSGGAVAQLPPKTPTELGARMREYIDGSDALTAEAEVAVQCGLRSEAWFGWTQVALQHETEQVVLPNISAMQLPSADALHWYVAGALMQARFDGLDRFYNQLGHAACDQVQGSTALHILDAKVAEKRR